MLFTGYLNRYWYVLAFLHLAACDTRYENEGEVCVCHDIENFYLFRVTVEIPCDVNYRFTLEEESECTLDVVDNELFLETTIVVDAEYDNCGPWDYCFCNDGEGREDTRVSVECHSIELAAGEYLLHHGDEIYHMNISPEPDETCLEP